MKRIITLEENVKLVCERATNQILKFTVQLFTLGESNFIEAHGSAILFQRGQSHYLISAAHCFRQKDVLIKVGVVIEGTFHHLKGDLFLNFGEDEKIDVAVMRLTESFVTALKRSYSFISDSDIMPNENLREAEQFLIVGYPITKTFINHKRRKLESEPFVFLAESKRSIAYAKLNYNLKQNFLLGNDQRRSAFFDGEEMNMGPSPKGISRCGLWYLPSYFSEEVYFKLSGIIVEHPVRQKKHFSIIEKNLIVATKNHEFLKLIFV